MMEAAEMRYLELLACSYPEPGQAAAAAAELECALSMPVGTELFASDVHGEYAAFSHVLRSGCGALRAQIAEAFGDAIDERESAALSALICYPAERLDLEAVRLEDESANAADAWLAAALTRVAAVARVAARGRMMADVRSGIADSFAALAEELLAGEERAERAAAAAVRTGCAADLIVELALLIQRLNVAFLHLVGDVYDRGPAPHLIMDELMEHHSVDIQWGNHDIVWMGAALGQRGCIAHVVRNCARYGNLSILEDAYGINLRPLAAFAQQAYADDPCVAFGLKGNPGLSPEETELNIKIQKAMAILQFKVEAQLIDQNPGFGLEDRKLLHRIDWEAGTVQVDGVTYPLKDTVFPTVDPCDPYRLTPQEESVMAQLEQAFSGCAKLQEHMRFLLDSGSLYAVSGNTLMFHACVPLTEEGNLLETDIYGERLAGRALFDACDGYVRAAFDAPDPEMRRRGRDLLWYLWLGQGSPLFAKSKMATFELYLIEDKAARKEVKNPFYSLLSDDAVIDRIFEDFGMDPAASRIVCGHVPVKVKDGEDPVKCGGRVVIVDGGFSSAYQKTTGVAGFTLVSHAEGVDLAVHQPLESREAAIAGADIRSEMRPVERFDTVRTAAETDDGIDAARFASDLERLADLLD